jgi:hypothetical protein
MSSDGTSATFRRRVSMSRSKSRRSHNPGADTRAPINERQSGRQPDSFYVRFWHLADSCDRVARSGSGRRCMPAYEPEPKPGQRLSAINESRWAGGSLRDGKRVNGRPPLRRYSVRWLPPPASTEFLKRPHLRPSGNDDPNLKGVWASSKARTESYRRLQRRVDSSQSALVIQCKEQRGRHGKSASGFRHVRLWQKTDHRCGLYRVSKSGHQPERNCPPWQTRWVPL